MPLTAVTLLGENTVTILADICRYLTGAMGASMTPDDRPPGSSSEAVTRAGEADVIWACGYLMCDLIDSGRLDAEIVAAPVFDDQSAPVYHSVIVAADPSVRSLADARGRCLAINERASWSGHHALARHLATLGTDLTMFDAIVETGSHHESIDAVAGGDAEIASIDHTVWYHLVSTGQVTEAVRVVDTTQDWPSPPFAVHRRVARAARSTLVAGLADVPDIATDGLAGTTRASRRDYDVMIPAPR